MSTPIRWTPAKLSQLVAFVADGIPIEQISERMGHTPEACSRAYARRRKAQGLAKPQSPPWTSEQDSKLRHAREVENKTWDEISTIVGRTPYACRSRLVVLHHAKIIAGPPRAGHTQSSLLVDPEAASKRLAYAAAQAARDLTAQVCGDPPIGWRALDRKRETATP